MRKRLDQQLVDDGHFQSRARARDAILRRTVSINGAICDKPAQKTFEHDTISVSDPAANYVSRAALKLVKGLDLFEIDPTGKVCLDVGASTGGFTQVLLERGAKHVHAIDVGHDQLHQSLRSDDRVTVKEGLNARDLRSDDLDGDLPELIVSDVSFISIKLALPPALDMAAPGARGVFLVKPQFEAGKEHIGKGGIVSAEIAQNTATTLRTWLNEYENWIATDFAASPITGADGNKEWLLCGQKAARI